MSDRYALEVAERAIAEQADRTEAAGDRPGAACLRMVADHVRWLAVRS